MKRWFLLLGMLVFPLQSVPADFEEGVHYVEIPFSDSLYKKGGKVQVNEFFWYGCGHCFSFEPVLNSWLKKKPAHIDFVTTPAFLPKRMVHAKAYYAFKAMGKLKKLHGALFNAIHIDKKKLNSEDILADFVGSQGEDASAFRKAFNSFAVDHQSKLAAKLGQRYGVNSVPTLVIDGRFITTGRMAGNNKAMLELTEFLAKKIIQGAR